MTDRRTAMMLLAAGVLPASAGQFVTAEEHRVLDSLCEKMIPGASEARVADFIDLVLANSARDTQERWRAGVKALGAPGAFERAAQEEQGFFAELKRMTIHAYYTSEIGLRRELGYRGPEALSSFPGCKRS